MTNLSKLTEFDEKLEQFVETKENPEEWYVLIGNLAGEYSVHTAEKPDDYDEAQEEMPPEYQDATESVDGVYQIGTSSWTADAFAEDCQFVDDLVAGGRQVDKRLMNLLVVHEEMLSEEALAVATEDAASEQEGSA